MKGYVRHVALVALVAASLLVGCLGGAALDRSGLPVLAAPAATPAAGGTLNTNLITEAWNTIRRSYVEPSAAQPDKLTYGAISGMVDSLGDTGHSTFLTPEMRAQQQHFTQGHFDGIGAEVQVKDDHVVIVAPLDGSPAQKAGLKAGDVILKVDGQDVTGQPLEQVVSKILGPAGTQVTLTIQSEGQDTPRDVILTRARIQVDSVTWNMLPGTQLAHIRIAGFSENATKELQGAITDATKAGATGIVLDLRNNPGGLLSESIGVASEFLRTGNVLKEKNARGDVTAVPVQPTDTTTDLPMVVLINEGTASASEIVSGALQDHKRATLVGETTFGTGTVLNEFGLSDGSALLLATEEWLTPNGRVIWHQGIAPDVKVSLAQPADMLTPEREKGMTAEQLRKSGDAQLLKGVEILDQGFVVRLRPARRGEVE